MSIFATIFQIEDERQWITGLQALGVKAGVIRDGDSRPEDLDAPYVYQGSHVLPELGSPRGGAVELACIPAHVRFWREHPDEPTAAAPDGGCEPWLRLSVHEGAEAPARPPFADGRHISDACVLLTLAQVKRLQGALEEWVAEVEATAPA